MTGENANFLSASVEDYGLGGLEMSLDSGFQWGYNTSLNSPGSASDITNWKDMKTTTSGANVVIFIWPNGREAVSYRPSVQKFATFDSDGSNAKWVDSFTIDPTWCLGGGNTGIGWRAQVNKYWVAAFKFQLG